MSNSLANKIEVLKKEKNAIILAHYYVDGAIQEIADYVGDSYYLSKIASNTDADVLVFAGVNFMADSAKILNPNKIVLHPDVEADCPMAHMVTTAKIAKVREMYDDLAVVCYINSSSDLKAASDVCVTSANAVSITKALPNKNIFFIPDRNLAHYVADRVPEKHFIYNEGFCHVHENMNVDNIIAAKIMRKGIKVLAHPECNKKILAQADFIGSTTGIIEHVSTCDNNDFYICTEIGVIYQLEKKYPDRRFYYNPSDICPDMKKITMQKIYNSLVTMSPEVKLDKEFSEKALKPLIKMLELSK